MQTNKARRASEPPHRISSATIRPNGLSLAAIADAGINQPKKIASYKSQKENEQSLGRHSELEEREMGKKWYFAVKKLFSSESKESHAAEKPKKRWDSKNERHTYTMVIATAAAAGAAAAAARAAAEVARLTTSSLRAIHGKPKKEAAAIKIQAAFRGYLARRRTWGLRGMIRLRMMANRSAVKRQTVSTLHNIQTVARVQSQIRERRLILSEENQALHRLRQQLKPDKEQEKLKLQLGEDWVHSPKSKEQFEAKLQQKHEAAIRRERTLAYAYSHQWRSNSGRSKRSACRWEQQYWGGWSGNSNASSNDSHQSQQQQQQQQQHKRRHSIGTCKPKKPLRRSLTSNPLPASAVACANTTT